MCVCVNLFYWMFATTVLRILKIVLFMFMFDILTFDTFEKFATLDYTWRSGKCLFEKQLLISHSFSVRISSLSNDFIASSRRSEILSLVSFDVIPFHRLLGLHYKRNKQQQPGSDAEWRRIEKKRKTKKKTRLNNTIVKLDIDSTCFAREKWRAKWNMYRICSNSN